MNNNGIDNFNFIFIQPESFQSPAYSRIIHGVRFYPNEIASRVTEYIGKLHILAIFGGSRNE